MERIDLTIPKGAIFSDDGRYRYALWRVWSTYKKPLMFIGLNPSTANQFNDDPTITRLIKRAAQDEFGGVLAGNLYALVSSDPKVLTQSADPIGAENDFYLNQMVSMSKTVLCAWGSFSAISNNPINDVLKMINEPFCLGINNDGKPKHPLYISYHRPLTKYTFKREK